MSSSIWRALMEAALRLTIVSGRPMYSNRFRRLWCNRSSLLCWGAILFEGNAYARLIPKPYSYDLGQKVIQAIKLDGLKIYEASILWAYQLQHNRQKDWSDKRKQETF
jgi:hypothetical protein